MKITRNFVEESTLEDFARKYNLEMVITERPEKVRSAKVGRYYAAFRGCEVREPGLSIGVTGNGNTEDEAMWDYAQAISGGALAVYGEIIRVPQLTKLR